MTETSTNKQLNAPPEKKNSLALILAVIAIVLLLLVSAGGGVYIWQQFQTINQNKGTQTKQVSDLQTQLQILQANITNFASGQSKLNDDIRTELGALLELNQFNSKTLAQLKNGNRLDWLLAESEYLLRLANQRLNLEQDVSGAALILSSAEQVLSEIDDPAMQPVQVAVAEELMALRAISHGDKQATYAQIEALISSVSSLPDEISEQNVVDQTNTTSKETPARSEENTESSGDGFTETLNAIGSALKSAIKIRKVTDDDPPLLVPEQRYFLKQNLLLIYQQSSLALLGDHATSYVNSLEKAERWLTQYFKQSSPAVKAHLEKISELKSYKFNLSLPDISGSLRLLKTQIDGLYRQHALNKHLSQAQEFSLVNISGKADQETEVTEPMAEEKNSSAAIETPKETVNAEAKQEASQ